MLSKISSMLDAVADSLEARGLIKEAYEIDKIADETDWFREKADVGPEYRGSPKQFKERHKMPFRPTDQYASIVHLIDLLTRDKVRDSAGNPNSEYVKERNDTIAALNRLKAYY